MINRFTSRWPIACATRFFLACIKTMIVKAYEQLAREEIIYNKRGLGYFVTKGAKKQILKARKTEFMKERLPELFRQMRLLEISMEDIVAAWERK